MIVRSMKDYRGLWTMMDHHGLSWAIMGYYGLSWILDYHCIIMDRDYYGITGNFLNRGFWTIMVYHGLSRIMDCHGLSWIIVDDCDYRW